MLKMVLLAGVAVATCLTFSADHADAFGGRGYARRQARHAYHHVPAPVVVQRVYAAPVIRYRVPVVTYYRAPVYHSPVYNSYYRSSYPAYGGVSVRIGW